MDVIQSYDLGESDDVCTNNENPNPLPKQCFLKVGSLGKQTGQDRERMMGREGWRKRDLREVWGNRWISKRRGMSDEGVGS